MNIEQPRFPTPEDERCASLLWQAMHESVDANAAVPAAHVHGMKDAAKSPLAAKPVKR